jgi:hypothetical protein
MKFSRAMVAVLPVNGSAVLAAAPVCAVPRRTPQFYDVGRLTGAGQGIPCRNIVFTTTSLRAR